MEKRLTQKEIGRRIMELRKSKEMSQEDLAKFLHIPRSSVAQIELGNRNISIMELIKLSDILHFSLDTFLSKDYKRIDKIEIKKKAAKVINEMRISVPKLNVDQFKNVLLYILELCGGKPNVGETVLYKLLFFSDFNYYELYEEHLTGARYKKLPYGPVPQRLEYVLNDMINKGQIQRIKTKYHGYPQTRYIPLEKADLKKLSGAEKDIIDKVIERFSDWSAAAFSEYSHKDMPWLATEDGEYIDYELVFYREIPYSVRVYNNEIEGA